MTALKSSAVAWCLAAALPVACVGRVAPEVPASAASVDVSQLWEDPADLETRNLFYGPGEEALAPKAGTAFTFVKTDQGGYSPGYDVKGPDGIEWSVKLGPEAQTEVAVSRILWAVGYHQVPTYYLATWTLSGGPEGTPGPARFRPEMPNARVVGEWSWYENDFLQTQPFKGLVVINVLLNNWDWKTSNNKIYEVERGEDIPPRREFVVRDLGASLGKTDYPRLLKWFPTRGLGQGSRNDLEDFEKQGFIKRVDGETVEFVYRGIHHSLIETIGRTDVVWASQLLSRLSDEQWNDAFRAAGYTDDQTRRYVAKIKSKVAEGLALAK
jgi:hypothetical protein